MKQTAVEWLVEQLKINKYISENAHWLIDEAKEMEKRNTRYFGAKCCIMTTQEKEWTLEELYEETFKK